MKSPVIRIGNQTAYSAGSVLEPFEFAVAHGFQAFEFFPDRGFSGTGGWAEDDLDPETRQRIRETAAAHGIELTVHATLEFHPLQSPDHPRLAGTIGLAVDLGASLVNLHLEMDQGAEAFVQALRPTLEKTAEAGMKLAIENTVHTGPDDFNAFFSALRADQEAPADHVGMCLDLGHANLYDRYRNNYIGYLDAVSPEVPIIHLHLHENHGDRDSHLPLFTGPSRDHPAGLIALVDRLAKRSFDGCAILEQWPHPPSLLVEARDRLTGLLENRG
ncbi:sugar phosphate isomerase/epimerase family protein [Luteolibacter marinus]|uniref:sugar phosphate isomerase/epimerase family protein n=1 Tax=Luteolibacter marinus TaxID=2776705 RepID=UPI0018693A0C|nr:sugar phosphate isomerase/epimerase family protein [Luteolibacter marinus]